MPQTLMCPHNSIRKLLLKARLLAPVFIWMIQGHISNFIPWPRLPACPHFPHPCSFYSPAVSPQLITASPCQGTLMEAGPQMEMESGAAPSQIPLLLPSPCLSPSGCSPFQQIQQLCSLPGEAPAFHYAGEPQTWFQSLFQGRFAQ